MQKNFDNQTLGARFMEIPLFEMSVRLHSLAKASPVAWSRRALTVFCGEQSESLVGLGLASRLFPLALYGTGQRAPAVGALMPALALTSPA
jgi:hypothetical protein